MSRAQVDDLDDDPDGTWGDDEDDQAGGRDLTRLDDHWEQVAELEEIEDAARTRRVPLTMTAVTASVGMGGWGAAVMADTFIGPGAGTAVAVTVCAGTAVAVPVARALLRERIADRWVRTWWTATSCAACWVDVVVANGTNMLTPGAALGAAATLVLGSWALGSSWWAEHEVLDDDGQDDAERDEPAPAPVPAVAPAAPVVPPEALDVERVWASDVADGPNPLARRSTLSERTLIPNGWQWRVQLERSGATGAADLVSDAAAAAVALKLGRRASHVIFERVEGGGEDVATLTVVMYDVLAQGVPYEGPNYEHGRIRIGRYADGTGPAHWVAYDRTGVQCGIVVGEQRSGKSALMAKLAGDYKASGEWSVLFADGDPGGGSSPELSAIADDLARGPQEALQQLEALEAIQASVRADLMGTLTVGPDGKPRLMTSPDQVPADKMLPCPDYPGIVWFLDELHRLMQDPMLKRAGFAKRVEKVVRGLAKYGVALIVGTQSMLGPDFGGDSELRAMLSKNTVIMRTANHAEVGVVGDGSANPTNLPKGGGYAYLGDGVRHSMIRTEWSKDPETGGSTLHRWLPHIQSRGVHPDELTWAVYRRVRPVRVLDRHADYAERTARLAAVRAAIASGAPLPGSPEARATAAPAEDDGPPTIAGMAVPTLDSVVVPLRGRRARADPPAEQVEPTEPPRLTNAQQAVHDDLVSHPGPQRTAEIAERTEQSTPTVSKALGVLVKHGLAHRPSGVQGVHASGPAEPPKRGATATGAS